MTTRFDKSVGQKKNSHDRKIDKELINHIKKYKLSPLDILNNFQILIRRQNLKRFLLHYQLFQKTIDIPGDIIELGVYRGMGLMTWANFLETHNIGNRTKKVYGFDNWKGFTSFDKKDGIKNKNVGKNIGSFNPAKFKKELENAIKIFDNDRFVGWKNRVELINGDVSKTIKNFNRTRPGIKYSLVHFDMDLYKPTKVALKEIWPNVSKGGVVIFDEYSIQDWPGETKAVDEFFSNKKQKIYSSPWTNSPAGWVIK